MNLRSREESLTMQFLGFKMTLKNPGITTVFIIIAVMIFVLSIFLLSSSHFSAINFFRYLLDK